MIASATRLTSALSEAVDDEEAGDPGNPIVV
jgi:hypothetical protein